MISRGEEICVTSPFTRDGSPKSTPSYRPATRYDAEDEDVDNSDFEDLHEDESRDVDGESPQKPIGEPG